MSLEVAIICIYECMKVPSIIPNASTQNDEQKRQTMHTATALLSNRTHNITPYNSKQNAQSWKKQSKKKNYKNKATFSISSFLGNLRTWKPSFQELASAKGPHALFSVCLLSISLLLSLCTASSQSALKKKKRKTSIKTRREIYSSEKASLMLQPVYS